MSSEKENLIYFYIIKSQSQRGFINLKNSREKMFKFICEFHFKIRVYNFILNSFEEVIVNKVKYIQTVYSVMYNFY